jgi:hypothetical protein
MSLEARPRNAERRTANNRQTNNRKERDMTKPMNLATTAAQEIEWGVIEGENTDFVTQFPRLQWVHGEKKASGFMKNGGLFISKEQYPNFTAEGFEPTTLITRKGDEIEGFAASQAKLAVIRIKHQWVKDETYSKNTPLAHALCVIKGNEDLLCISLRGPSKALAFQQTFNQHISQNVSVANRTRPQGSPGLEPFALWFPLAAGAHFTIASKDGKSESVVTSPEIVTPEAVDRAYVTTLWVGADNYKKFASYWKDTAAWQKAAIWEQRNGDDVDGLATIEQIEHLIMLCEAKGMTETDIMQGITHGARSKFTELTAAEVRDVTREVAAR